MKIIGLWLSDYYSGSTDERFVNPLKSLGHYVDVVNLSSPSCTSDLMKKVEKNNYDFLINVPYRDFMSTEIIRHISFKTKTKTILWNGDDDWEINQNPQLHERNAISHNYIVTTFERAMPYYDRIGMKGRVYLESWGFSKSDLFKKRTKKDTDIYFCGARTPERDYYLRALREADLNPVFEGAGYTNKKISLSQMIDNYRRAKIGLNFTFSTKDQFSYSQVKARNFEIPALGTFQLSEDALEMNRFFKSGKNIETFTTAFGMIEKIKFYLKNPKKREAIAKEGYKAVQKFSYENIFKRIFERIQK